MKTIISRLTMKKVSYLFIDKIMGIPVNLYVDKYGEKWMAFSPFGFRCKYKNQTTDKT